MRGSGDRRAAVVFDLDGTLVDTMTIAPMVYVDTIRALGGAAVSPDTVVATWHIGATPVVLEHFLGRPVTGDDLACYRRHFAAAVTHVRPFPGVPELVAGLARAGCRLGVYTAATRWTTVRVLAGIGLDRLITVVVGGDEVGAVKPAPDGLRLACRRLGVAAADAAYVGDTPGDLRCAEAAGALGVYAGWGATSPAPPDAAVADQPVDVLELVSAAGGHG